MKLTKFILLSFLLSLCLSSCKSKEEKAADLIRTELSKTLYDFDSYEPIETKVSEAYLTADNDSTCMAMAMAIAYGMKQGEKYIEDAKEAQEHMDI